MSILHLFVYSQSGLAAVSEFALCLGTLLRGVPRCSHILVIQYQLVITKVNNNLVSWRAKGCKRFPSDVEPYPYPRLHGHVTPNASCVTVNNPAFVKPSQIKANPL